LKTYPPDSRFAAVLDRSLDLLLVMVLLGAPLIFYTKGHDVFEFNKFTAVRDFSALAAVLFLAKLLFVRPLRLTRSATDWPLLAWLSCCFISAFHTVNLRLSLHGVYEDFEGLTSLINYVFLLYLMQQHVRSERQIRLVIGSVILAGTISGFYGMLQNFGIDFVPWNPATYSADRMFSTMGNPNFLAAYLVMSLPICLVVVLDLPWVIKTDKAFCLFLTVISFVGVIGLCVLFDVNFFNFDPSYYNVSETFQIFFTGKFWIMHILLAFPLIAGVLLYFGGLRTVILISMVFQLVAILFTKSRGGGLAVMIIYGLIAPYAVWDTIARKSKIWKENWIMLGLFHLLILLALIFIPQVQDTALHMFKRIFELTSSSNVRLTPRLYIWRSALQMMGDHFWFGSGLDTFQVAFPQYRLALYWILEWNGTPEKAHNVVMQTAATMGLAGLISFFWLNAAAIARAIKDLSEQMDASRRLLIIGCFAAAAAFFVQDLFSFTVVGYGSLYWMLIGFIPAMHRTWLDNDAAGPQAALSQGGAGGGLGVWRAAVIFTAGVGLLALLAGSDFSLENDFTVFRECLVLLGIVLLGMVCWKGNFSAGPAYGLLALVACGYFLFAVYSTRIWVADSFYKQGQVGIQINNPGFAAAMYQKAAGRIVSITPDQEQSLYTAAPPTSDAGRITFTAGLNPDQELYWVKMGIAFENAAAAATKPDDKLTYYRTALAIHQLTLEMNPINGYNYNNKGRVLKSMGEAFNQPAYFQKALDHYRQAIRLDQNNVYFNLDCATTLISLGDFGHALEVCQFLMEKFPDFAMPYSYAGFVKLRQNQSDQAIEYFRTAVDKDWKGDMSSRALAATNLGILLTQKKRVPEAAQAYATAVQSNPDFEQAYVNWGQMLANSGHKDQAIQVLKAALERHPDDDTVKRMLNQMGAKP
jgi:tetratricopeptide (TPR) repeat protein/O-antigen ligase